LPPDTIESTVWASGKRARSRAPSPIIQNEPSADPRYVYRNVARAVAPGSRYRE
jgi:hypothetical protein